MIKVVPYLPEHIQTMDLLECFEKEHGVKDLILQLREAPDTIRKTLLSVRGEALAVIGGFVTYRTVNIWAAVSKLVRDYPKGYHKVLGQEIDLLFKEHDILRVQSVLFADNAKAIKQHRLWGFEVEGLLRKAGPNGEDQLIMAKVV